jgi:hypothetical protein
MTAVMQNNPSLTITDDEDDVALAAFLAPNWGRFDQDQLVSLSSSLAVHEKYSGLETPGVINIVIFVFQIYIFNY